MPLLTMKKAQETFPCYHNPARDVKLQSSGLYHGRSLTKRLQTHARQMQIRDKL